MLQAHVGMCAGGREGWVLTEPWEVGRLNEISKDEEVVFRRKVRKAFLGHAQHMQPYGSITARKYFLSTHYVPGAT